MMSNLFLGRDTFINFSVSVTGVILIIPALFCLFFIEYGKLNDKSIDDKQKGCGTANILFWLVLISCGLLVAPGTSYFIQRLINGHPYIDTMIAIPTALVTIYAFIHLTCNRELGRKGYIGIVLSLVLLIVTSSSVFMTYGHPLGFELISNPMKISPEVEAICETVGSDSVFVPEEIYGQIGEFDSQVNATYQKDIIHNQYYTANFADAAEESQNSFLVIRKSDDDPATIELFHYKKIAETDHYMIYQRSDTQ